MTHAPKSTAAFNELIDLLVDIRDGYVQATERFTEELDVVEGFRYVTQLLSEASELLVEADPERPRFSSIVSPARKFLGDNPDALYQQAIIRGDRSYRVTGRRDEQTYISFTIHGPDPNGGINGPVLADRNDRDFTIDSDGTFEIILSPDAHPGNWIKLEPDARMVIVRNYYLRERSIQTDPDVSVVLDIEPLDDPGPAPALDDATLGSAAARRERVPPRHDDRPARLRRSRGRCRSSRTSRTPSGRHGASGTPASTPPAPSTSTTRRGTSTSGPTTRW